MGSNITYIAFTVKNDYKETTLYLHGLGNGS
nr:MAG TPA: hydrolase [Bacteriophage sp.]